MGEARATTARRANEGRAEGQGAERGCQGGAARRSPAARPSDVEDGDIDRAEKTRRLAAIDAEMPMLESGWRALASLRDGGVIASLREGTLKFEVRDWDNPAEVNAELRNLWQRIELGPDMQPVRAVWNIGQSPAERAGAE